MLLAGLGSGIVGAAAAAAPMLTLRLTQSGAARPASWWDSLFLSLKSAGLAEWTGVIGQTFTLATANGSHLLRVAAVNAFPRSGRRPASLGRSQAFSVVFETVSGGPLPARDGLYQLAHRTFEPLPIYMSAPSRLGRATRLIAVFN